MRSNVPVSPNTLTPADPIRSGSGTDTSAAVVRSARLLGAGGAVAMGLLAGLALAMFDLGPPATAADMARFAVALVTLAVSGAALGPLLLRGGGIAAAFIGLLWAGVTFAALTLAVGGAMIVDIGIRDGLGADLVALTLLGPVALLWDALVMLPAIIVAGLAWAILVRSLNRIIGVDRLSELARRLPDLRFARGAIVIVGVTVLAAALTMAAAGRPASARCLDVDGEVPLSGAWSPGGGLLAIASTSNPNRMGHVRLFEWPSGRLLAQWPGWVEDRQTVVVDDDGRVVWVSTAMEPPWAQTLMAARAGETPRVLVPATVVWSDLSLVNGELRGRTGGGDHRPVSIPLTGPDAGRALPLDFPIRPLGRMWWSPDGQWAVGIEQWSFSPAVVVHVGVETFTVELPHESYPRTFALTPDRSALVTASWTGPSTITDLGSGAVRRILDGRQRWISVSERGDVAWANDDGMPSRPCVVALDEL